jgi:hypothetical protein
MASLRARGPLLVALALTLVVTACGASGPDGRPDRAETVADHPSVSAESGAVARTARVVRVVAAGDIACPPGLAVTATQCRQMATSSLALRLRPALVLALGDTQYDTGALAAYRASYAPSWGRLLGRTRPVVGNHEYETRGAAGYYSYFRHRQPGPPGYYRVRVGAWQAFVLNANCDKVRCGREVTWLNRQLRRHPSRCSLVAMHQPRFSSGSEHGNDPAVAGLWRAAYKHRVDLVLAGHDHDYERFKRLGPRGQLQPRRGMVEMVVGTGGRNLRGLGTRKRGSAYFQASAFGVLRLDLGQRGFSWGFHTIDGLVLDRGHRTCV